MITKLVTTHTITLSNVELKKLIIELRYFLDHNSWTTTYKWDEDPIADANLRDSEDYLRGFYNSLSKGAHDYS